MAFTRDVRVNVLGDTSSLERSFRRSSDATKKFGKETSGTLDKVDSKFKSIKGLAAGAFAGGAVATAGIAAIRKSVEAASDLNEQITKSQQVFGQSSKAVLDWSDTTAKALGVSKTAALEAAGTFGNLFSAVDIQGGKAAQLSQQLVQLAADLASFNNADPSDVLLALRSGITGEVEPLRKFGILLSEARVQQEALRASGKASVQDLTNQEKVTARLAIIFRDTSKAQGDFARTSSGLANQQRILNAEVADLEANLGKLLLPAVQNIASSLVDATDDALTFAHALQTLGKVRIPEIRIPLVTTFGGGTVGGAVGGAVGKALKTAIKLQFLGITGTVASVVKDQLDGTKKNVQSQVDKFDFSFKLPQAKLEPPANFAKLPGVKTVAEDLGKNIRGFIDEFQARAQKAVDQGNKLIATDKAKKAAEDSAAKAEKLRDARQAAFDKILSALELTVDKAGIGGNLQKQLGALEELKAGLERQVKAGVDVQSAQSQLVQVVGAIGDKQKEIQKKAQEALQSNQFRALGLTAGGDALTPTVANLKKQLEQLSKNDLSSKAESSLARIGKVLSGSFGKVTEETRSAIKRMFDQIRGELDKGAKTLDKGPLTKTTALSSNKILAGLGLDRDTEKLLRARLSGFNSSGLALAGKQPKLSGSFSSAPVVVQSNVTVELDGDVLARSTTRAQQKAGRRNPKQKRGPNTRSGV